MASAAKTISLRPGFAKPVQAKIRADASFLRPRILLESRLVLARPDDFYPFALSEKTAGIQRRNALLVRGAAFVGFDAEPFLPAAKAQAQPSRTFRLASSSKSSSILAIESKSQPASFSGWHPGFIVREGFNTSPLGALKRY